VTEKLPSLQTALKLLSESGCSKRVIAHCKAVSDLAVKFANSYKQNGVNVDVDLVEIGALLHDIGRSKTHNVNHAIVGVEIARSLDLPQPIISIIERHVGGGISADEAEKLGWPVKNYFPTTLEEKIVSYADKLIEGLKVVPIEKTLHNLSLELGANHPAIARIKRLHEELSPLIGDLDADSHGS
jgi:uncharacterized protein